MEIFMYPCSVNCPSKNAKCKHYFFFFNSFLSPPHKQKPLVGPKEIKRFLCHVFFFFKPHKTKFCHFNRQIAITLTEFEMREIYSPDFFLCVFVLRAIKEKKIYVSDVKSEWICTGRRTPRSYFRQTEQAISPLSTSPASKKQKTITNIFLPCRIWDFRVSLEGCGMLEGKLSTAECYENLQQSVLVSIYVLNARVYLHDNLDLLLLKNVLEHENYFVYDVLEFEVIDL